ncbi:MAG: type II toxin-antitoxin system HipA family toxin [Trebonia sp.]
MTSQPDSDSFDVWIGDRKAGTIHRVADRTRFSLDLGYREDPDRPVLGLVFEDRPERVHVATVRLAPWFSNLLPEGRLRDWIADERGVSRQREMELLAQVGHDLPGAVQVLPAHESPLETAFSDELDTYTAEFADDFNGPGIRFSLAGVGMKFSMLRHGDRMTMPGHGEGGDWIVKTPDARFRDVPLNEFAMMTLAGAVGIDVPEIMLVPRERVDARLPGSVWPEHEEFAYAIRRFDRDERRGRIHIEDLAQVRNVYPEHKYKGNFETVASLIYRGHDKESLLEFTRRLAFSVLIANGDYHLKNWSLIYPDGRVPSLSPAYDLMSTAYYFIGERVEDLGLKFGGYKDFHRVTLATFRRLQQRLGARDVDLAGCAALTVERALAEWPRHASLLDKAPRLQEAIDQSISMRSKTIMGSPV